ncbi:hypothetical protein IW146_009952, partial [Coemansia sp. RSA 922]
MYNLDLNFGHGLRGAAANDDDKSDPRLADSDYESDSDASDVGDYSPWANMDRRLLQRIIAYLPRQSDRRAFCLVSREWALAGESSLWAYPEFSTPKQLASFLRVVSDRPSVYGPHIRGIRFTLASHYDRHLTSPYYCDGDMEAELPTLMEVAQGKHVLSTDPTVMRSLLHGSDLTSPPLALRFARMCSPIDRLSIYGFRLRDKYIVNDLMRWSLRELEIVGMPRKPLANLSYLLRNLRSLRSLRIESDSPLPADTWGPLALRLPQLNKLRIWAPSISGGHLLRAMNQAPQSMVVLHLVGRDNDVSDEFVGRIVQGSPHIQSLVINSANITARSAVSALTGCARLTHLELARDEPEYTFAVGDIPSVVASRLTTLALQNLDIPDMLISQAASVVTSLRSLHISGAGQLTGESVGALLRDSTRLAALGLFNCARLSEELLDGLAQGPSAQSLRVLMVRQCAVQSEGVESVLSAFPNIKHLSVVGVEIIRQQYEYIYVANALEAVEPQGEVPVQRSFKVMYPSGHHFCKSDPTHDGCPDESQEVELSAWDNQRAMWDDDSASRFVPGLLAFANGNVDSEPSVAGRRRAATISSEDHLDAGESASDSEGSNLHPVARRLRSNSDQPSSNLSPVAGYDSIMPTTVQQESAPEESAEVDRAIDRLEHEGLESAAEVSDAAAEDTNEAADLEPTIDAEDSATRELAVESVAAEEAVDVSADETRAIAADAEPDSSDIASIAGGTALALVAAGVALAAFGGESVDETPEPTVDQPSVDSTEEPAVEATESTTDEVVVVEERSIEIDPVTEGLAVDEPTSEAVEAATEESTVETAMEETVTLEEPAVEESTRETVEAVADESVDVVAEAVTEEAVADVVEEVVAEAVTEEAIADVSETVANESVDVVVEAVADEPADVVAEAVAEEVAADVVEEVVAEAVADEPADVVAEAVAEEPAADVVEEPAAETVAEEVTADAAVVPVSEVVEVVAAESIAEEPAREIVEEPAVETAEVSIDEPAVEVATE